MSEPTLAVPGQDPGVYLIDGEEYVRATLDARPALPTASLEAGGLDVGALWEAIVNVIETSEWPLQPVDAPFAERVASEYAAILAAMKDGG